MNKYKLTALIISLLVIISVLNTSAQSLFRLSSENSSLLITGTSTIHDWEMEAGSFTGNVMVQITPDNTELKQIEFTCPVIQITSGNRIMDNKTRAALNEKEHPVITFRSDNIYLIDNGSKEIEIKGNITIAGKTKEIVFKSAVDIYGDSSITAGGIVSVNMKEYDIDPPVAMLGALKTGEEVKVKYNFEFVSRQNEITKK
ncbi:MAG: YceI family protein [Prolixibacteraceae bacterium]|nr:YceI family protein [Prolixibacteraceae bacterium]